MLEFDSLSDLRNLLGWAPPPGPRADTDEARRAYHDLVVGWLVDDGGAEAAEPPADGEPVTLFVLGIDASSAAFLYAVPDRLVTTEQRAALEALSRGSRAPVFCYEFHGDISPPEYAGALWTLVLLRPDDGICEDEIDRLAEGVDGIDTHAMKSALGGWMRHEIGSLHQLPGPIRHAYAARFAM